MRAGKLGIGGVHVPIPPRSTHNRAGKRPEQVPCRKQLSDVGPITEDCHDEYFYDCQSYDINNEFCSANEYINEINQAQFSPKDRLKNHLSFWTHIDSPHYILDVISNGYKIPFCNLPPSVKLNNNRSARADRAFVTSALLDLLEKNCITELQEPPYIINPLSVSYNSAGKPRLILDLSRLNNYIWKQKVKFEDWRVLKQYVQKGGYMIKWDLSAGYHHISINADHQTYLGFQWEFDNKKRYLCYNTLPFGLSSGPYIFTKLCRPLVRYRRSK